MGDSPHRGGDHPYLCRSDAARSEFGGGGRQRRGQHLPSKRPPRREQPGVVGSGLGLTLGQIQYPGQQPRGGTKPGDRTRPLGVQLRDHLKDPRIGPPEVGLGVAQHSQQPVNAGLGAILLHRGHPLILAGSTDNFRPRGASQKRNPGMRRTVAPKRRTA
jgi:hypothetical protein